MKKVVYLVLLVSIISCNKKNNAGSTAPPSTTAAPTNYYGGELNTLITQYNTGASINNQDSVAYCSFVDANNITGNTIYAGNVSYNGVVMQYYSGNYQDTTFQINLHQPNSVWHIAGNAQVQSFSYTNTPSYPKYTGNNLLPDSISKSAGITINFGSSFSNATDSITITVGLSAIKKMGVNQTSCYFSSADLMYISINNASTIEIEFNKQSIVNFNNRNYYVNNRLRHIKYGVKIKA